MTTVGIASHQRPGTYNLNGSILLPAEIAEAVTGIQLHYPAARLTSFRAASPNMSRVIPVINRFTPTRIPMAQIELEGQ